MSQFRIDGLIYILYGAKFLTVENFDKSGLGKSLTSKKLTNANVFILLSSQQ